MGYWCSERLVVTVVGPTGESVATLDRPFARVGSHPDADVVIADSVVARRALYLHGTPAGIYCLFLDMPHAAAEEEKGRWLGPDQEIAMGDYRVRASLQSAETGDTANHRDLAAWGSAPPPLPVMMVYCGDLLKDKRRFRATLSAVGRRPQCGLQLKGKKVSSFHCVLYWDRVQLWCIDLTSSNGTTLNGQPLDCSPINIGDRLEVGEFGLVFQRISQGGGRRPAATARRDAEPPVETASVAQMPAPAAVSPASSNGAARAKEGAVPSAVVLEPSAEPAERTRQAADEGRLRDEIHRELVRLASEREAIESHWNAANAQLQQQIADLRSEAAQLAREREVLAASRNQWLDERNVLTQELAERSARLAQVEADLSSAAATLSARLAEDRQPRSVAALASGGSEAGTPATLPDVQAQWEEASERLRVQIEQLQAESAELANQRQVLEESRHDWQAERQSLTETLATRAEQLGRLEAELASTSAELKQRLAAADARREEEKSHAGQIAASDIAAQSPAPLDQEWLNQLAPAAVVAGLEPAAAGRLSAEMTPEVAWSYAEVDPADELPPLPDPQAQMQASWEAANQQLSAQVQQLRAEAAQLAGERQALLAARDSWLAERDVANERLAEQQQRLAGQQAELTAAASMLTTRLTAAEQRLQSLPAATISVGSAQAVEPAPMVTAPQSSEPADEPSPIDWEPELTAPPAIEKQLELPADLTPAATNESLPAVSKAPSHEPTSVVGARRGGARPHESEKLALLVSTRVGTKYAAEQRRWLWWTAGGIAAAVGLAAIVAGLIWALT